MSTYMKLARMRQDSQTLTLQMMRDSLGGNKSVRFMEQEVDGVQLVIVCYMVNDPEIWQLKHGLEARGITFRADTGECVCRPFEKFFRLGECEFTEEKFIAEEYDRSDFSSELLHAQVLEKMDGSMVTPVLVNGNIFFKSKKSFYSDVAIAANHAASPELKKICADCLKVGLQLIFEFTSADHRIVIDYGDKANFTLIAQRWIHNGAYFPISADPTISREKFGFDVVKVHAVRTFEELKDYIATATDTEGVVVNLPSLRFKMKTKWYDERHRIIDLRERDVADAVLDESLDDIIAQMVAAGKDVDPVRDIERAVLNQLIWISETVENHAKIWAGREMRDVAAHFEGDPLRGYIIACLKGREIDIKKYWRGGLRFEYSLRSIGNPNF